MSEVETHFRIVCHGAGYPGHHEHVFEFGADEAKARMMKDKRDAEWARSRDTEKCVPFHVEKRQISEWEPADE